jgi:hypothetical protein
MSTEAVLQVREAVDSYICDKPHLHFFCSDVCIRRFLKARHDCPAKAGDMLLECLHWCVPSHGQRFATYSQPSHSLACATDGVFACLRFTDSWEPAVTCGRCRRESQRIHAIKWSDVQHQARTGKVMIAPIKTRDGRPVLILRPHHENNTKDQEANIKHFAYQMEAVTRYAMWPSCDCMVPLHGACA